MEDFAMNNIVPFANLVVLSDKIYKGLYLQPTRVIKEVE